MQKPHNPTLEDKMNDIQDILRQYPILGIVLTAALAATSHIESLTEVIKLLAAIGAIITAVVNFYLNWDNLRNRFKKSRLYKFLYENSTNRRSRNKSN